MHTKSFVEVAVHFPEQKVYFSLVLFFEKLVTVSGVGGVMV